MVFKDIAKRVIDALPDEATMDDIDSISNYFEEL